MNLTRQESFSGQKSEFAHSSARSQEILARLRRLYPALIDLSLGRLAHLLDKLGRPQDKLPPVFHVAGTNGKGSTCAFLRALGAKAGLKAHILTSPHLISVTERFRIAGKLVKEPELEEALLEIERKNAGDPITLFEVLTAAGFLLFSRVPADFAVIEVGMGGLFDATNLVSPAACLITPVSFDHQNFLGDDLSGIAKEKAGIIKPHIPVFSALQSEKALIEIQKAACEHQAPLSLFGKAFNAQRLPSGKAWRLTTPRHTAILPLPALVGEHQIENAALACAAFEEVFPTYCPKAFEGVAEASWPARLQRLNGSLAALLPKDWGLWVDGAHNPHGAASLAKYLARWQEETPKAPVFLIMGLKEGKKASEIVRPLLPYVAKIFLVSEEHQYLAQEKSLMRQELDAMAQQEKQKPLWEEAQSVRSALLQSAEAAKLFSHGGNVVICGSLYLAGEVLQQDGFTLT